MTFVALETSGRRVEHVVRARHAATGRAVVPLSASWEGDVPRGALIRVIDGTVVVSVDERFLPRPGDPPLPVAAVRLVAGGTLGRHLAPAEVVVQLDAPTKDVAFQPAPMTLAVELVRPGTGARSTGRTVEARASNATRVPLPEEAASPGTYRSAARVWSAGFNPLDLLVGNTLVRRIALDFARTETRVTVVDPT